MLMAFTMSLSTADRGQLWLIILMGVWLTAVSPTTQPSEVRVAWDIYVAIHYIMYLI
jgi:hypothetical protein